MWKIWYTDPAIQPEPDKIVEPQWPVGETHAHMAYVHAPDSKLVKNDDTAIVWVGDEYDDPQQFFVQLNLEPSFRVYPMEDNTIDYDGVEVFP